MIYCSGKRLGNMYSVGAKCFEYQAVTVWTRFPWRAQAAPAAWGGDYGKVQPASRRAVAARIAPGLWRRSRPVRHTLSRTGAAPWCPSLRRDAARLTPAAWPRRSRPCRRRQAICPRTRPARCWPCGARGRRTDAPADVGRSDHGWAAPGRRAAAQRDAGQGPDPACATEAALNANPLRKVIPVDWAEIVRALRTALPASCRGAPTPRSGSAESHPIQAEPRIIVPVGTPAGPPLRCGPRPVQRTAG